MTTWRGRTLLEEYRTPGSAVSEPLTHYGGVTRYDRGEVVQ